MGADYRFTIVRKADKKPIATFYYNRVKNVNDVWCKDLPADFSRISCDESAPTVFQICQIESSEKVLADKMQHLRQLVLEKKLLSAAAKSVDIKHDFEQDVLDLEAELTDYQYAWSACESLLAVATCLVEDLVVKSSSNEDRMAYVENAKGLEGKTSIWLEDVELHAVCFC